MNIRRIWMAGILAPALALAQAGGGGGQQPGGEEPGSAAEQGGVVHGVVRSLNYPAGVMMLASTGRLIRLHGTPAQLRSYQPGEFASVAFENYSGTTWLANPPDERSAQNLGAPGKALGVVSGLNKSQGTLILSEGDQTFAFKAHPETLQSLVPGQLVSVTYADVVNQPWIESVRSAQSGAPQTDGGAQ